MQMQLRRGRASRLARFALPIVLLAAVAGVVGCFSVGSASADLAKPTIAKDVDANGDPIFSDTENVPKTVTYPWTVTYRLTVHRPGPSGAFHTIVGIPDSTTSDIGSCGLLAGTTINNNQTIECTYTETFAQAGTSTFVNTATLTYDSGGNDVLSNDSNVDFPGMTLDKSSTTTLITSAGQVVPYSYLVSNTGTSVLTGISLVDNNTDAAPSCPATTLAVAGSMTCTGQHTVTLAELLAGANVVNVATVSSNEAPDATDTVSIPIVRTSDHTGALTMGFWQNKNGQGIINDQAATRRVPLRHLAAAVRAVPGSVGHGNVCRSGDLRLQRDQGRATAVARPERDAEGADARHRAGRLLQRSGARRQQDQRAPRRSAASRST